MKTIVTTCFHGLWSLLIASVIFSCMIPSLTTAQSLVKDYQLTPIDGKFQSLTESKFGNAFLYQGADDDGEFLNLPFDFNYDNNTLNEGTPIFVCSNGFMVFNGNGDPVPDQDNWGLALNVPNTVAPFNTDFVMDFGQLWYSIEGSSPDRVLTIEWNGVEPYSGDFGFYTSFQVKLYETSNVIEFWYADLGYTFNDFKFGPVGTNSDPTVATVGLYGDDAFSDYIFYGNDLSATPKTNLRFTPNALPNVQLGLTPNPKFYNFGTVPTGDIQTTQITVTNVGDESHGPAPLQINSINLTGSSQFSIISSIDPNDMINVGDSRTITVKFAPVADGLSTATMTVVSNGVDSGTQSFQLTGIGLAPLISVDTNIIFKNKFTKLGDSLTARILIYSTNTPAIIINSFQFSGLDAGEYHISRYPSSMTIPGGTVDSVFITYVPTKEGRHTATLTILNNSVNNPALPITLWGTGVLPHITINPNPVLFDSVDIGVENCKTITIHNPGTDTLFITSNKLVSNDGDFIYTGLTGADSIIPPDKSKTVTVCFVPLARGSRVARLRLTTNIPKTFEQPRRDTAGQFLIDIQGNGVPTGLLSQTIGGVEGGGWVDSTIVGTTICIDDSLINNGDADILINDISLSGANKGSYTISGFTLPFILQAKSTKAIRICATPTVRGIASADITVKGTTNEQPIQSIHALKVKGLQTCASAEPMALFQNTVIVKNTDSIVCTTVTNCGDVAADYTATITGASASDYTVTPGFVQNILPGQTAQFCVKFNRASSGKSPATLTISAPNTPSQDIPLTGEAGCAIVSAQLPNLESMGKGGKYQITLTITNTGNFDWTPTGIQGLDSAVLHYISGLGPIAPGGNIQIVLEVTPDDINHHYNFPLTISGIPCEESAATATIDFTTSSTGVAATTSEAGFVLGQNYPNPVSGSTTVNFTVPTESMVHMSLTDLTGATVREIISGRLSAGEHTASFDLSSLSSGTYIYLLESNGVRLSRYLVLTK
jgi:hypothetical protein